MFSLLADACVVDPDEEFAHAGEGFEAGQEVGIEDELAVGLAGS